MALSQANNKTSLYELIAAALVNGSLPDDYTLPQEAGNGRSEKTDGCLDGLQLLFIGIPELTKEELFQLALVIDMASEGLYENARDQLQLLYKTTHALNVLQPMLDYIDGHDAVLNKDNLRIFAHLLTTRSASIECVKFGLILLSTVEIDDELRNVAYTLALSDEFSYYALLSLKDDNESIFKLAKHVYGWGRAEAILVLQAEREEIKTWLLFEGIVRDFDAMELCIKERFVKSGAIDMLSQSNSLSSAQYSAIRDMIIVLVDEPVKPYVDEINNFPFYLKQFLKQTGHRNLTPKDIKAIETIYAYYTERGEEPGVMYMCEQILERNHSE